ncbi:hypothetical protein GCM10027161_58420 [Microbispora hainanensis]
MCHVPPRDRRTRGGKTRGGGAETSERPSVGGRHDQGQVEEAVSGAGYFRPIGGALGAARIVVARDVRTA